MAWVQGIGFVSLYDYAVLQARSDGARATVPANLRGWREGGVGVMEPD